MANNTNTLTEGNKSRIKPRIVNGAQNFNKYLNNKVFLITCEDGSSVQIRFFQKDYKHLTGIYSNLDELEFYNRCLDGSINTGNIDTNQHYNWSTLNQKTSKIENLYELLYADAEKTLLLKTLKTNTKDFPVAIRNDAKNICVGFAGNANKARTLRKATASKDAKEVKRIVKIQGKKNGEINFSEAVYEKKI